MQSIGGFFNQAIRVLPVLSFLFLVSTTEAAQKRYIVTFKDTKVFQALIQQQKGPGFSAMGQGGVSNVLGVSEAKLDSTFEHLGMAVISADSEADVAALTDNPAIAGVEEEVLFAAPKPIATWTASTERIFANNFKDLTWGLKAVNVTEAWNTTRGSGVRVMVLDSGVDRDHPDLVGRFEAGKNFYTRGTGEKVLYDFWDDIGHGTHVAGTILADGAESGLLGVAPDATLLMGRVCGLVSCSSVAILGGLNWAIEQKVDVISMSLGGGMVTLAERLAFQRAEEANIVVVAAAGNSGLGHVSYPAALDTVVAVGALNPDLTIGDFSQWGPELDVVAPGVDVQSAVPVGTGREAETKIDGGSGFDTVVSLPFQGTHDNEEAITGEIVHVGLGLAEDFEGVDLTGRFALIQRGEISFGEKVSGAIDAGAAGVLIYNNEAGLIPGSLSEDRSTVSVPVVMIEQTAGEALAEQLASGETPQASIKMLRTNYAAQQGTSMACPHVSGVVALMRSVNKTATAAEIREALESTATVLGPNEENKYGAGLIHAGRAVEEVLKTALPPLAAAGNQ